MKKKFRILAAALALCLSVLYSPAALAGGSGTTAAAQPVAAAQTISTVNKTEQQVWIPTHGAVSYTHLDVYKRQALGPAAGGRGLRGASF